MPRVLDGLGAAAFMSGNDLFHDRAINLEDMTPSNRVAYHIKQQILYRQLKPGDKIPTEDELCQTLNVSRTSVREALKSLSAINLITIRRGDGTYISNPEDIIFSEAFLFKMLLHDSSMEELLTFREHMEMAVMQAAIVKITPEQLEALRQNLAQFEDCINTRPDDYRTLHRLDMEFHGILGQATGNRLLQDVYSVALDLFAPTIMQNYMCGQTTGLDAESTRQSHKLLLEALEERNTNLCSHAVWFGLKLWQRRVDLRSMVIGALDVQPEQRALFP